MRIALRMADVDASTAASVFNSAYNSGSLLVKVVTYTTLTLLVMLLIIHGKIDFKLDMILLLVNYLLIT